MMSTTSCWRRRRWSAPHKGHGHWRRRTRMLAGSVRMMALRTAWRGRRRHLWTRTRTRTRVLRGRRRKRPDGRRRRRRQRTASGGEWRRRCAPRRRRRRTQRQRPRRPGPRRRAPLWRERGTDHQGTGGLCARSRSGRFRGGGGGSALQQQPRGAAKEAGQCRHHDHAGAVALQVGSAQVVARLSRLCRAAQPRSLGCPCRRSAGLRMVDDPADRADPRPCHR